MLVQLCEIAYSAFYSIKYKHIGYKLFEIIPEPSLYHMTVNPVVTTKIT